MLFTNETKVFSVNHSKPLYKLYEYSIEERTIKYKIPESIQLFKDSSQKVMNGFYLRENKRYIEILNICNGILQLKYKIPKIDTFYTHPMISWHNLLHTAFTTDEIETVIEGKKPVGFSFISKKEMDKKISLLEKAGIPFNILEAHGQFKEENVFIAASQPGKITDYFDFEEIIMHYVKLLLYTGFQEPMDVLGTQLLEEAVFPMLDKKFEDFIDGSWEYANPKTPAEDFTTGLLLGYPIESTYAFMFGAIKLSSHY